MNFKVLYSQEKDVENYINSVWHFSYKKHGREGMEEKLLKYFPEEFKGKIKSAKSREEAVAVVKDYLDNLPQSFKNQTQVLVVGIERILEEHKLEVVGLLESAYRKVFPFELVTVFLTTLGICPYNYEERWFMTRRNNDINGHLDTAKHELNHFMFYYYYRDALKNKLSSEKIENLKEALAILTNPEGNNKPGVKELEGFVSCHKDKTIDEIIELSLSSGLL